ncbi:hypothetical protein CIL03_15385 [Virgibacillus indicus]|uniref:DUF4064 domain-containing protein n=1 Tax=Virgibacillus indicus TaxID=2024554 RepID=A0A265N7E0_9BACI|nr:DUF4064 domain-containing protein [Virgibacillus indicus]OZU87747.1 hypothetical protein CIL03_15385 [Virgibacillus indicus]
MKRTAEIILGIIGALVFGIFTVIGAVMVWLHNNEGLIEDILNEETAQDFPEISMMNFNDFIRVMGEAGWQIVIISLIAIMLGIVAMVLLKGNKKPTAAGIIFIATTVIVAFINMPIGIFAGIFYLIAGILCLARKPKVTEQVIDEPNDLNS